MYSQLQPLADALEGDIDFHYHSEHIMIRKHLEMITKKSSRYQIIVTLLNCLIWVNITYTTMVAPFVFMNPLFECDGVPTVEHEACQKISQCIITNNFTATYSLDLYCQKQSSRVLIQSVFPIGCLLGMILLPMLGDSKGRRGALLLAISLEVIGTLLLIAGLHFRNIYVIVVGHVLIGFFAAGASILTYVISSEVCTDSLKQSSVMFYNAVWGFSEMSFYWIYTYFPDWQNYILTFILIPSILTLLFAYLFLMETPDYLLIINKGSYSQYRQMMLKMGEFNKMLINQIEVQIPQKSPKLRIVNKRSLNDEGEKQLNSVRKIWESKQTVKLIVLISLGFVGYNVLYFGMQGSMERTGYNFGVSMILAGSHEFIAFLLVSMVISNLPRKKSLLFFNFFEATLGLSFILPFVSHSQILQTMILSILRITCVFSYSLFALLQIQSFNAEIKSTAIGLTTGISQLGRIIIPGVVNAMNQMGIHPLIACAGIYLMMGTLPVFFIEEQRVESEMKIEMKVEEANPLFQAQQQQPPEDSKQRSKSPDQNEKSSEQNT